ncbi:MAG: hypothetical protein WAM97_20995 [Acidimicrobiales bacterium]
MRQMFFNIRFKRTKGLHQKVRGPERRSHPARPGASTFNSVRLVRYGIALFVFSAVLFSTPAGNVFNSAAVADTPQNCPGGVSQCVTVQIGSGCSSSCPTVTIGPTTNVGNGEYVYIDMTNFPTTDFVRVAYCPITDPPEIVPGGDPQCANGLDPDQVSFSPIAIPVEPDGTATASYPTQFQPSGDGNAPLPADPIISNADPKVPFYCDNGPDYCGIEVEDLPNGATSTDETSANTAIIPITFASTTNGCPTSDPQIQTESAFSVEHFLPAAVDATCTGAGGVSALNVATNTDQVISDFSTGTVPVAFTDEPQDTAQQQTLSGMSVKYIPIAVSATVMGFLDGDFDQADSQSFPVSTYELTPNMVAGLITSTYAEGYGSDLVMPPLDCNKIYECGTKSGDTTGPDNYDTFDLLNPVPSGTLAPGAFGMFFSSTASGSSYQVTNWACSAPNVPITVTVPLKVHGQPVPTPESVTDPNVATTTLVTPPTAGVAWPPPNGNGSAVWPYTSCTPYSDLPVLASATDQYQFDSTPELQAYRLRGYVFSGGAAPPTGTQHPTAGFGALDWSEASYLGLNSAAIQNAAGVFVTPSQKSIDAALGDATVGSNGVLAYNYDDTGDPLAYPMPLVTYAVVPTSAQTPANSQAEGDLLTNLVCYSYEGGTSSVPMPTGYVPLTQSLYNQARQTISSTFPYTESSCNGTPPALPGSSSGSTGKKTTTPTAPRTPIPTTRVNTTTPITSGVVATTPVSTPSTSPVTAPPVTSKPVIRSSASTPPPKGPGKGFEPEVLALAQGTERWIVAGLGGAALLGLIVGPLLVLAPRARRRLRKAHVQT